MYCHTNKHKIVQTSYQVTKFKRDDEQCMGHNPGPTHVKLTKYTRSTKLETSTTTQRSFRSFRKCAQQLHNHRASAMTS